MVLIPSSSGQGSKTANRGRSSPHVRLNPFFFRAGFEGPGGAVRAAPRGLNPFFFRAGFEGAPFRTATSAIVLIPSSSGQGSKFRSCGRTMKAVVLIPSSSGQGSKGSGGGATAAGPSLNPFFFRAGFEAKLLDEMADALES